MAWKIAIGVVAAAACAIVAATLRHRRPAPPKLGEVSMSWIAEHRSGLDS